MSWISQNFLDIVSWQSQPWSCQVLCSQNFWPKMLKSLKKSQKSSKILTCINRLKFGLGLHQWIMTEQKFFLLLNTFFVETSKPNNMYIVNEILHLITFSQPAKCNYACVTLFNFTLKIAVKSWYQKGHFKRLDHQKAVVNLFVKWKQNYKNST